VAGIDDLCFSGSLSQVVIVDCRVLITCMCCSCTK